MLKKYLILSLLINLGTNTYLNSYSNAETNTAVIENIQLKDYSKLRGQLEDFIYNNSELKKAYIGIKIKDLKNSQEVYSLNADKLFIPASNMKVFTTLLSLEKLGKDYKFITKVTTDGNIEGTTLKGNLYINFVGDPTFKSDNLKRLLIEVKNQGIDKISGNVFINASTLDNIYYGPGWMWDDMDSCDSSPIDGVYMDDNCLKANVVASNNKIYSYTTNPVTIDTSGIRVIKEKETNVSINEFKDNSLKLSGSIGDNKTQELEQAILNPESYVIKFITPLLKNYFSYEGQVNVDRGNRASLKELSENVSIPVAEILKRFNKESHNLTGELLIKTIAQNETKTQGSTKKGTDILKKYLEKTFSYSDFNIVDGSGLSRYNLVSPALMSDALNYIYNSDYKNIVMDAFPVGGKEGTLKNRLTKIKDFSVIAKSGSMTGVNCLSGYLKGDNGQDYSFSIMINNANLPGKTIRDFQDNILKIVTDYKP